MRKLLSLLYILMSFGVKAQVDSTSNNEPDNKAPAPQGKTATKIFMGQRLINANTVEVLNKGKLEFKVIHNFQDFGGSRGGFRTFFGMDNAADIKIAFQLGLSNNLNIVVARVRGDQFQNVQQLWEMGLKYRVLKQMDNDKRHPFSLTVYANGVVSSMKANTAPNRENSYSSNFMSRTSNIVQVMIARKFGKVMSLQLNPTYVHTNYVVAGDDRNIFAIGGGLRVPISKTFVFIADYFHAFRSKESKDSLNAIAARNPTTTYNTYGVGYDAIGVGLEIVTPGHVFHLNFTNATNILENRFIPRTLTTWRLGQFRWGFTVARDFMLFRPKQKK